MEIAFVVQPNISNSKVIYDYTYLLEEAINLTIALDIEVLGGSHNKIREVRPSTFLTKGFVEDLKVYIEANSITLLVVNDNLNAIQQRNLERILDCKVLDRNGLIINIFSKRAKSKEGVLQAELASLMYQKSRLVKAWSHLERQRGGGGFVGGPGETQKELDKRMISDKIIILKKQLEKLKQNRAIQSNSRRKNDYKVVALVGYTNAGKSTLFNALTNADAFIKDLLFATLDTTMRVLELSKKEKVILLDTVGFISDLPHQLIEAFKSTLDEVKEADLILHVIDSAQENYQIQIDSVKYVLNELGINKEIYNKKIIEVYNKLDILNQEEQIYFADEAVKDSKKILISARDNINLFELKNKIFEYLAEDKIKMSLELDYSQYKVLTFLYKYAIILKKQTSKERINLDFLITQSNYEILNNKFLNLPKE